MTVSLLYPQFRPNEFNRIPTGRCGLQTDSDADPPSSGRKKKSLFARQAEKQRREASGSLSDGRATACISGKEIILTFFLLCWIKAHRVGSKNCRFRAISVGLGEG